MALTPEDITRLYDRHADELLAFFVRLTYHPDAGVDLLAETFAAAFEDRNQFRGGGDDAARAWLYGIARHQLLDFFRRGQVERPALRGWEWTDVRSPSEYDRIEELAASDELRGRVAAELAGLPPDQRDALRLRVVEERPYGDVARSLRITEQTARARVSRGLRALRESSAFADLKESAEHV